MGSPIVCRLRVRYNECDQQGVVFNAHYFAYFDLALTEAWREVFGSYGAMLEQGLDVVVAEATARFLGGARFDDELELRWSIRKLGNTSMTTRIDVVRDGEALVEGEMRHVFVRVGTTDKLPIPAPIRDRLEPHVVAVNPAV